MITILIIVALTVIVTLIAAIAACAILDALANRGNDKAQSIVNWIVNTGNALK